MVPGSHFMLFSHTTCSYSSPPLLCYAPSTSHVSHTLTNLNTLSRSPNLPPKRRTKLPVSPFPSPIPSGITHTHTDQTTNRPAEITIIVCWVFALADVLFIYWWCKRENVRKARLRSEPGYVKLEDQEWLDLTDRENGEFVYAL